MSEIQDVIKYVVEKHPQEKVILKMTLYKSISYRNDNLFLLVIFQ